MSQKQNSPKVPDNQDILVKYTKAAQIEQILTGVSKKEQRDILDLVLSQIGYRSVFVGTPTFNPIKGLDQKIKEGTITNKNKGKRQKSLYKGDPEYDKILSNEQNLVTRIKSKKKELNVKQGEKSNDPEIVKLVGELHELHVRKTNRKTVIQKEKGIPKPQKGSST